MNSSEAAWWLAACAGARPSAAVGMPGTGRSPSAAARTSRGTGAGADTMCGSVEAAARLWVAPAAACAGEAAVGLAGRGLGLAGIAVALAGAVAAVSWVPAGTCADAEVLAAALVGTSSPCPPQNTAHHSVGGDLYKTICDYQACQRSQRACTGRLCDRDALGARAGACGTGLAAPDHAAVRAEMSPAAADRTTPEPFSGVCTTMVALMALAIGGVALTATAAPCKCRTSCVPYAHPASIAARRGTGSCEQGKSKAVRIPTAARQGCRQHYSGYTDSTSKAPHRRQGAHSQEESQEHGMVERYGAYVRQKAAIRAVTDVRPVLERWAGSRRQARASLKCVQQLPYITAVRLASWSVQKEARMAHE